MDYYWQNGKIYEVENTELAVKVRMGRSPIGRVLQSWMAALSGMVAYWKRSGCGG